MTATKTFELTDQHLAALADGGKIWIDEDVSVSTDNLGISLDDLVAGSTALVGGYQISY